MGAQMAPSQLYMVRVPYPCRDQEVAFPCFQFMTVRRSRPIGIVFQARTLSTKLSVRPCFPLTQQDASVLDSRASTPCAFIITRAATTICPGPHACSTQY